MYSKDQPRVEKGNSNGGQWTGDSSNEGSSKDDKESSSNSENSENEESEKPEDENAENAETSSSNDEKAQNISNEGMSYSEPKAISSDSENKSEITYNVNESNDAIGVSFTSADKSAEQNLGREDAEDKKEFIQDKNYSKDPSEAVLVSREYEDQTGLYINTTIRFDGFEANQDYTIAIEADYKYTDKAGETHTENVLALYDMKSDNNGIIIAERVAVLACEDNNIAIDEAEISLSFYSLEGRVNDNFSDTSYIQDIDNDTSNLNNQKNTNISQSLISHAKTGRYDDNGNIQENNQGGGMKNTIVNSDDAINLLELNIKSKR